MNVSGVIFSLSSQRSKIIIIIMIITPDLRLLLAWQVFVECAESGYDDVRL